MKDKIVFINGVFDQPHPGHIQLINYASWHGKLYIAIDSDRRVKELKGSTRPFFNQLDRIYMLKNIKGVHKVFIFDSEQQLENLIFELKPDIMVVGSDYRGKKVIGSEYAKELHFFNRDERYSTTKILNHYATIRNRI